MTVWRVWGKPKILGVLPHLIEDHPHQLLGFYNRQSREVLVTVRTPLDNRLGRGEEPDMLTKSCLDFIHRLPAPLRGVGKDHRYHGTGRIDPLDPLWGDGQPNLLVGDRTPGFHVGRFPKQGWVQQGIDCAPRKEGLAIDKELVGMRDQRQAEQPQNIPLMIAFGSVCQEPVCHGGR